MQIKKLLLLVMSGLLIFTGCEDSDEPEGKVDPPVSQGNFHFVQHETTYSGSNEFVVLHGDIYSLSDSALSITVTRVKNQIPDSWSSAFCVGPACLPPFLNDFTFSLAPGDTALFSIDTYPNAEPGQGSWTFVAVDSSTMEIDSVSASMDWSSAN